MIQYWVSDADALQFDYSVRFSGFAKRWGRYIVNRNAGRRFTLEHPIVRVTMKLELRCTQRIGFSDGGVS
jgi:hypothetical protein